MAMMFYLIGSIVLMRGISVHLVVLESSVVLMVVVVVVVVVLMGSCVLKSVSVLV